jgi:hypothetical protein
MSEQAAQDGSYPIKVQRFFYESMIETEQRRALPDNSDFAQKLFSFLQKSPEKRAEIGKKARQVVLDNYTWDKAAKVWEDAIDAIEINDRKETWFYPNPRLLKHPDKDCLKLSNPSLVEYIYREVLQRPDMVGGFEAAQTLHMLYGGTKITDRGRMENLSKEQWVRQIKDLVDKHNFFEKARIDSLRPAAPKTNNSTIIGVI